jgi:hypothetical protein
MTDSDQQGSERVDVDRQTEQGPTLTGGQRRAERRTAIALGVAILAGIGLFIVYFAGGQTQIEGILFFIAFGGFGIALGIWANHLLDAREVVEERHELTSGPAGRQAVRGRPDRGGRAGPRPPLVARQAARRGRRGPRAGPAAAGAVARPGPRQQPQGDPVAAGPAGGRRERQPVTLNQVPEDGFLTVFPEGHEGAADAQTLLIHVRPGSLKLPPERWPGCPRAPTSPTPRSAPTPAARSGCTGPRARR